MDVKVKYLVTAKINCSRTTGGPYVDAVEGEEDNMRLDYAEHLKERGKLEIVSYKVDEEEKERSDEDKIKDALMAQAKDHKNINLTRNMKVDTMLKKFKEAEVVPNLESSETEDKEED